MGDEILLFGRIAFPRSTASPGRSKRQSGQHKRLSYRTKLTTVSSPPFPSFSRLLDCIPSVPLLLLARIETQTSG
jgi:hypothetical protein